MHVILAEKTSQAIAYYIAFTGDKRSEDIIEKEVKPKGYILVKNVEALGGVTAVITWAIGHLTQLKEPEEYKEDWKQWSLETLPIIPNTFEYRPISGSKTAARQFENVKYWLEKANTIVWAGDIDREGSYISYSICSLAGVWGDKSKTYKSLWVDDLSPKPVLKGFRNLQSIDYRYKQAIEAQTRAKADWLIGMNASRALALYLRKYGHVDGKVAVGRIMTPTLFFVYLREQEIENFVPRTYYELEATFEHPNGTYKGKYIPLDMEYTKGDKKGQKWKGDCDTKEQWEKLIADERFVGDTSTGIITEHTVETKFSRSPRLFNLSGMQRYMNKKMGLDPNQVLEILEELYDKDKVTTYPRTPSVHISKERYETMLATTEQMADQLGVSHDMITIPEKADGFYVNNKKAAVHAALTVTEKFPTKEQLASWSEPKRAIYIEIAKRCMAMFLPKYEYEQTTIITKVGNALFKTIGNVPKAEGWKVLWKENELLDSDEAENKTLIPVEKGNNVKPTLSTVEKTTTKPPLYTLGTLLDAMETAGRQFEDEELRQVMAETQGLGTEATRASILDKLVTNEWIVIKKGKVHLTALGRLICYAVEKEKLLSDAKTTALWEQSLRKITEGTNTPEKFLGNILRYLGVNSTESNLFVNLDSYIKTLDFSEYKESSSLGVCPNCGAPIKVFKKVAKCENGLVSEDDRAKGKEPSCDFIIYLEVATKKITKSQVADLVTKRKTRLIKGFKRKNGETFDAHLILNDNNEVAFASPEKKGTKKGSKRTSKAGNRA